MIETDARDAIVDTTNYNLLRISIFNIIKCTRLICDRDTAIIF